MNGREIFRHAVRAVVDSSLAALARAGIGPADVDLFVPHQANARIITAARERLGIPDERCVVTIDRYGNTSSASIPLALADALETGPPPPRGSGAPVGLRRRDDLGQRRPTMGGLTPGGTGDGRPVLVMMAAGMARRYGGCKPLAPVGLHGEAVIDLNAGDAVRAGFGDIVLVLGPATGPAITLPRAADLAPVGAGVSLTEQRVPLGTAHAVLCARKHGRRRPVRRGQRR